MMKRADTLAKELFELNQRRQELTKDSVDMVIKQIEDNNMENDKVILVYNPYIHESILWNCSRENKRKI